MKTCDRCGGPRTPDSVSMCQACYRAMRAPVDPQETIRRREKHQRHNSADHLALMDAAYIDAIVHSSMLLREAIYATGKLHSLHVTE